MRHVPSKAASIIPSKKLKHPKNRRFSKPEKRNPSQGGNQARGAQVEQELAFLDVQPTMSALFYPPPASPGKRKDAFVRPDVLCLPRRLAQPREQGPTMSETQTFPTLPQGHKRFTVEQVLIEIGTEIGLGAPGLMALLHMMKQTAPDDWTSPDREPVYYAPQDVTAAALGKTRRALYNTERQLERLGFIERRVKGNGHRSASGGCGIVFSRLIAMVPDLLNLVDQRRQDRRERRTLRNRRSSFQRIVMRHIREAGDTPPLRIEAAGRVIAQWPDARFLATMEIGALRAHVEAAKSLCEALDAFDDRRPESSAMVEEICCRHIQENTEELRSVSCNASMDQLSAGKPAHDEPFLTAAIGPERGRERKDAEDRAAHKTQFLSRLTAKRLFRLASEDMRAIIRDSQGADTTIRDVHVIDGAIRILPFLGINHDAWEKAVEAMGETGAALTVLVLDANRDHPRKPVRNPGGALRAMTDRHRNGTLNLVGSLIGLSRRKNV